MNTFTDKEGNTRWFRGNRLHRDDGPAVIYKSGTQTWYRNGMIHRDDGPAIISKDGSYWYQNSERHRLDGPAVIRANGEKGYFIKGVLHRTDGPSIEQPSGYCRWHVRGIPCHSWKEFQLHSNVSDEDITFLAFRYGEIK